MRGRMGEADTLRGVWLAALAIFSRNPLAAVDIGWHVCDSCRLSIPGIGIVKAGKQRTIRRRRSPCLAKR